MNNSLDKDLQEQFDWIISFNIGRFYKKGWRWKPKLRWSLTKLWNDPRFNNGYVKEIRDTLGEEEATRLFQDKIDEIINSPALLEQAQKDWGKDNPLAQ